MPHTDILIIGSGASGLFYALKVADQCPEKKITIITKSQPEESNTKYAQGGVAVVWDRVTDNFDNHIEDTLRAGDGECKTSVVKMVVEDAPDRIKELIELGVSFDFNSEGKYDLGREGGHSHHRVIHHKDNTGEAIEKTLLKRIKEKENITILDFHLATELVLNDEKSCAGAMVLDLKKNEVKYILSDTTIVATGGCGSVYKNTTNPSINTGDGIALAMRAGASISNMQYIQFHPTAIYEKVRGKLSLVTEALRGAGAKLLNINKEPFMAKYDEREELASRDIVSRAIYQEIKKYDSEYVYLDCRAIDREKILSHFPNVYEDCKSKGYDLFTSLLPVVPASHYLCGGIDVDMDSKTNIPNLYAIGECSNTGLHGANRLASNSLLEALIYAHRAAMNTVSLIKGNDSKTTKHSISPKEKNESISPKNLDEIEKIRRELNNTMSKYVGIVRKNSDLQLAKQKIEELKKIVFSLPDLDKCNGLESQELQNMLCVCQLVVEQSINQTKNAGCFYNIDLDEK